MAEERWQDVGPADELRTRAVSRVRAGTTPIALVYKDGTWSAISGVCNHAGGPLGEGRLDGDYVVCPWHNWRFHRRTGEGEPGFEDDRVPSYATKARTGASSSTPTPARPDTRTRTSLTRWLVQSGASPARSGWPDSPRR